MNPDFFSLRKDKLHFFPISILFFPKRFSLSFFFFFFYFQSQNQTWYFSFWRFTQFFSLLFFFSLLNKFLFHKPKRFFFPLLSFYFNEPKEYLFFFVRNSFPFLSIISFKKPKKILELSKILFHDNPFHKDKHKGFFFSKKSFKIIINQDLFVLFFLFQKTLN